MLAEVFYGRARCLMLFVLTGVAGTVASYLTTPSISAGASAALFGLLGVLTVHNVKYRRYLPPEITSRLWILPFIVGLQLASGLFMPTVDRAGHVGGLLAGMLLGLFTESRIAGVTQGEREGLPFPAAMGTVALLLAYGLIGWGLNVPEQLPLLRGGMAFARGDAGEATRYLDIAVRRQPELVEARVLLAEALLEQQRWPEAVAEFRKALVLHPEPSVRYRVENALAYTLADSLNTKLDEAKELAETSLAARPDDPAVLDTLAWVYYRMGKFADAQRVLEKAIRQTPKHPEMQYHLGAILAAQGQRERAEQAYRQAIRLLDETSLPQEDRVRQLVEDALKKLGPKSSPVSG